MVHVQPNMTRHWDGKKADYEIRVKGHLDEGWAEWFGGLEITNLEGGEAPSSLRSWRVGALC